MRSGVFHKGHNKNDDDDDDDVNHADDSEKNHMLDQSLKNYL